MITGISTLHNTWDTVTEIDLRPLAEEALYDLKIVVVGSSSTDREILAANMRRDPSRPDLESDTPILLLDLESIALARYADLIILLLDGDQGDFQVEKEIARKLADAGKRVLVFVTMPEAPAPGSPLPALPWRPRYLVVGPLHDPAFLIDKFVPAVTHLLPEYLLALGRNYPLFRLPIARHMVNDTSLSNAAYSFATGLAEIVPILNIPLVITDMIVLTKNQAFLVYKMGLVFGFSTEWRSYVAEFGSVLGIGFVLRQFARTLVGLIPGFGIIPKVAVSYAGTEVVGRVVLQWYLTGRHISANQLKYSYNEALGRGKTVVRRMLPGRKAKTPKMPPALPEGQPAGRKPLLPRRVKQVCPQCSQKSAPNARFCQHCGYSFVSP